ncbi:hypothetical protein BDR07DRAFT_1411142 [Suillus spraguei]|nr:hypothetical protein BDR07DRAFT_1411142 [Suillus spraguei]
MSRTENTKRSVHIITSGSSDANVRVPYVDPQIHTADIAQFAQCRFEEKVERLAKRSGFQPGMIRDLYKHTSTFKQTETIAKAMRIATVKCVYVKDAMATELLNDALYIR